MNDQRSASTSRRNFVRAGVGAAAAGALAATRLSNGAAEQDGGSSTYDGPAVELEFWNGLVGADGPFMLDLIDRFNAENQNITVSMNAIPWGEFYQSVPAAVSSGRGPDLGLMHIRSLATNAARQVIVPMNDIASTLGLSAESFSEGRWESVQYEGDTIGIPLDMFAFGFYYNKTTMEAAGLNSAEPPMDNEAYISALEQALSADIAAQWQAPVTSLWQRFSTLLWQFGGDLFNDDTTEAVYNSDEGVEALTWLVDLIRNGYSPENLGPDAEVLGFKNNENAFHWNGPWMINEFAGVDGLDWDVSPMPLIGSQEASWSEGHNFVMFKQRSPDDDKLSASQVFIEWMIGNAAEWAKSGQIPALNSARETSTFGDLAQQAALATQLPNLHYPPNIPGIDTVILEPINAEINLALLLEKEPKAALEDAVSLANSLLEENRSKYQG